MPARLEPTAEELARMRELLAYDPQAGEFRWRADRDRHGSMAGDAAGQHCQEANGRRTMRVQVDGRRFQAAPVAWFLWRGVWPQGRVLTVNGDDHDIRGSNLRLMTMKDWRRPKRRRFPKTNPTTTHVQAVPATTDERA